MEAPSPSSTWYSLHRRRQSSIGYWSLDFKYVMTDAVSNWHSNLTYNLCMSGVTLAPLLSSKSVTCKSLDAALEKRHRKDTEEKPERNRRETEERGEEM